MKNFISIFFIGGLLTTILFLGACNKDIATSEFSETKKENNFTDKVTERIGTASITSITGYNQGGGAIVNGRHDGQPSSAPSYATNKYKGFLAVGFDYIIEWNINGSNFGTSGTIYLTKDAPQSGVIPKVMSEVTLELVSWNTNVIKVRARSNSASLMSLTNVYIYVSPNSYNPNFSTAQKIAGFVNNRGVGQCTWFVSKTRVNAGKPYPPSPYYTSTSLQTITSTYIPKIYDCLNYNGTHTGIITTNPILTETKKYNPITKKDEVVKKSWSFNVSEMNCSWDETSLSKSKTFVIELINGQWNITGGIGTEATTSWKASKYYR